MCAIANLAEILLDTYRWSISAFHRHANITEGHSYRILLRFGLYRSSCCVRGSGSQIRRPLWSQHLHFCSSTL